MFIHHFVDPDLRVSVKIFKKKKERETEKEGVDFGMRQLLHTSIGN